MARMMGHSEYLESDVWRCNESPTGAHHWIGVGVQGSGIFYCKWCLEVKRFPGTWRDYLILAGEDKSPLVIAHRDLLPYDTIGRVK